MFFLYLDISNDGHILKTVRLKNKAIATTVITIIMSHIFSCNKTINPYIMFIPSIPQLYLYYHIAMNEKNNNCT